MTLKQKEKLLWFLFRILPFEYLRNKAALATMEMENAEEIDYEYIPAPRQEIDNCDVCDRQNVLCTIGEVQVSACGATVDVIAWCKECN